MLAPIRGVKLTANGVVRVGAELADAAADGGKFVRALGEVDSVLVARLTKGADVAMPKGTTSIRKLMSDLTLATGNEVALLRLANGNRVLRMGTPKSVPIGNYVERVIAHTHPSGMLKFSRADIRIFHSLGQRSSVIIDPMANMGSRLAVPRPKVP